MGVVKPGERSIVSHQRGGGKRRVVVIGRVGIGIDTLLHAREDGGWTCGEDGQVGGEGG